MTRIRVCSAILLGAVLPVVPAEAQVEWFPEIAPFESLRAAPREVAFRGSFVFADRDVTEGFEGTNLEAQVAIGRRIRLLRLDDNEGADRALTFGLEVGVFARFFMEAPQKDLINSDWKVLLPLEYRSGRWSMRGGYRHFSSHLGDDYIERFPRSVRQTSKDGFEGLVAYDVSDQVRVYGGGEWNFHLNYEMSESSAKAGIEWAGRGNETRSVRPFLALDAEYFGLADSVGLTGVGGMIMSLGGRSIAFEFRGHWGPTGLGHFREIDETFAGLGIRIGG